MEHHIIEFDQQCESCKGTGLYIGMAEKDGAAIVCGNCKGTGCYSTKIEYDDFVGLKKRSNIKRVYQANPGIFIGTGPIQDEVGNKHKLSDFGGMPYKEWIENPNHFPKRTEMRKFTCPPWWYQSVDYDKKPDWEECIWGKPFYECKYFLTKNKCWERWDKEYE